MDGPVNPCGRTLTLLALGLALLPAPPASAAPPQAPWAPASLAGKRLLLDGEDAGQAAALIFRHRDRFLLTRSSGQATPRHRAGRYTYQRTGPYTATLRTQGQDPAAEACAAHLTFTAPLGGAYTLSCGHRVRRTGQFQLTGEDPFCRSLWDGLPCAPVAVLPQLWLGRVGPTTATAEVLIANRDPHPSACEAALLFHPGQAAAAGVRFDGRALEGNLLQTSIAREGAARLTLSAPGAPGPVEGALYVYARSPCTHASLRVSARNLMETPDGAVEELLPLPGQAPADWLGDGDCRVLAGLFGPGRTLGIAAASSQPGRAPPHGARLALRAFGMDGALLGTLPDLPLSGTPQLLWPWDFPQPRILELCLDLPGSGPFQAALLPLAAAGRLQYAAQPFAAAFRRGAPSAWNP